MEKNKLDKLFQDKLGDREFEFQDSFWKDAEALIEAEENSRRNRGLGWIFGLGLLALLGLIVGFFVVDFGGQKVQETTPENLLKVASKETSIYLNEDSLIQAIEAGNGVHLSLHLPKEKTMKTQEEKTVDFNTNMLAKRFEKEVKIKEKTTENYFNNKPISLKGGDVKGSKINDYKNSGHFKTNDRAVAIAPVSPILNDEINQPNIENTPLENQPKNAIEVAVLDDEKDTKKEITEAKEAIGGEEKAASIDQIASKFSLIEWENELKRSLPKINIDEEEYPPKSHRWNLQATAGVSSVLNPKSNDKSVANFFGGLMIGYRMTPEISLQSGLIYKVARANFDRSEGSRQVSYGFGKQDDIYYLKANQLHFVELPVLVGYGFKKTQFSAGFKIGRLMGAKGEIIEGNSVFPFERTDDENEDFASRLIEARDNGAEKPVFRAETSSEKGWLATDDFRPWQFSLVGQYQLAVSPRFNLGLGVEYRFNSDYLKNETGRYSPVSIQFFTSYKIFSN